MNKEHNIILLNGIMDGRLVGKTVAKFEFIGWNSHIKFYRMRTVFKDLPGGIIKATLVLDYTSILGRYEYYGDDVTVTMNGHTDSNQASLREVINANKNQISELGNFLSEFRREIRLWL